jgi:FdhD protein
MCPAAVVGPGRQFSAEQIMSAMRNVSSRQKLNLETRAVYAAAFCWDASGGIVARRADVGCHNVLDNSQVR